MTKEKIAIIKHVGYGCRDIDKPCLFFDTYISESETALQILIGKDADNLIEAYGVYDIKELNGKPIWVKVDGCIITVVKPCLIKN